MPRERDPLQTLLSYAHLHEENASAPEQVDDEVRRLRGVIFTLQQLASPKFNRQTALDYLAERARCLSGAEGAVIALREGEEIICQARAGTVSPAIGARVNPHSGFSGECITTARTLRSDDTELDSRVDVGAARQLRIRSVVAAPVFREGLVWGVLEIFSSQPGSFGEQQARTLELFSGLIAQVLDEAPAPVWEPEEEAPVAEIVAPVASAAPPSRKIFFALPVLLLVLAGVGLFVPRSRSDAAARLPQPAPEPVAVTEVAATSEAPAVHSRVLGGIAITYSSAPDGTTVAFRFAQQVKATVRELHGPERVYLDIEGVRVPAEAMKDSVLEMNDAAVLRIRVGQPAPDVTRIVLDLTGRWDYSTASPVEAPEHLAIKIALPASSASPAVAVQAAASVAGRSETAAAAVPRVKIVIDPGHGGHNLGTVGRTGLTEKDLVLDLAQRLGKMLAASLGAEIIYTRSGDEFVSLEERAALANAAQADLLVSIHANSSEDRFARGVETYYFDPSSSEDAMQVALRENSARPSLLPASGSGLEGTMTGSRQLAAAVQNALFGSLRVGDPYLQNRGVKKAPFVLLMHAQMPCILTEVAFLSSESDEAALLTEKARNRIAKGLYTGIAAYLRRPGGVKVASVVSKSRGQQ